MPRELKYIAQEAMDDYNQTYAGNTTFFTLEDWISRCGSVLGEYFKAEFEAQRAILRQEKRDEVVALSTDILLDVILDVKEDEGELVAVMPEKTFSFAFDNQNSGYQNVFVVSPTPKSEAKRSSINDQWQLDLLGTVNEIFWYPVRDKIFIKKKGSCNAKKIQVFYVPSISKDMLVPDGAENVVRTKAVNDMKIARDGIVMKQSNNLNPNATIQTEVDQNQFKPTP